MGFDSPATDKINVQSQPSEPDSNLYAGVTDKYGGTVSTDALGNKTTLYKDGAARFEHVDHTGFTLAPQADGNFHEKSWGPAREHFWQPSYNKEQTISAHDLFIQTKQNLSADVRTHIKDAAALKEFEQNMRAFEERARKTNISDAQIAQTYLRADVLLTTNGNTTTNNEQRAVLAAQIISQAADPNRARQGRNNTCGPTDVENATYTHHPEAAARLVSDVALTGNYTGFDGNSVQVAPRPRGDALVDGDRARTKYTPGPDQRSYASQIFQVATINTILHTWPDAKGSLYFQDSRGQEHALIKKQGPDGKTQEYIYDGIGTYSTDLAQAYEDITADDNITVITQLSAQQAVLDGRTPMVHSENDLKQVLEKASYPAVILLNADNGPLYEPLPYANGSYADRGDRGHYVLITGYSPGSNATVQVHNTQGESYPFGKGGEIAVHELYLATLTRKDAIRALQQDLHQASDLGVSDPLRELELLRMKWEDGQMNYDQLKNGLKRVGTEVAQGTVDYMREQKEVELIAIEAKMNDKTLLAMGLEP